MAETTEISWTDATFNPWMGCTKVGPGCDHCYAEGLMATRYGKVIWGAGADRVRTGEKNWNLPKRWNARPFFECPGCGWRGEKNAAVIATFGGEVPDIAMCPACDVRAALIPARRRVFCSSLADVFDNEVDPQWRADLFTLILRTPALDWLLLTKRIGNAARMINEALWANGFHPGKNHSAPPNVWLGATIVNQEEADRDIPKLLAVPARVRFLSMEPLLGPVDIEPYLEPCRFVLDGEHVGTTPAVDWVIVGGESGKDARPMNPDWVRSLGEQCEMAGVAFHFKQWGEWADSTGRVGINHPIAVWPDGSTSVKVGKVVAGRQLDGRTHNEFPKITP